MKDKTIKQLQSELDEIMSWFESPDVDIDQAEAKYQQGLLIAEELKARLKNTENNIKKLKQSFDKDSR